MSKNSLDLDYMNAKLNVKTGVKAGIAPLFVIALYMMLPIMFIDVIKIKRD